MYKNNVGIHAALTTVGKVRYLTWECPKPSKNSIQNILRTTFAARQQWKVSSCYYCYKLTVDLKQVQKLCWH